MDNTNGRYQGTNGQGRTFSRSWLIHGEAEAGRLLLEAMWNAALRSTGLSTAHCPVKGIFQVGGGPCVLCVHCLECRPRSRGWR